VGEERSAETIKRKRRGVGKKNQTDKGELSRDNKRGENEMGRIVIRCAYIKRRSVGFAGSEEEKTTKTE